MAKALYDGESTQVANLTELAEPVAGGTASKPLIDVPGLKQILFAMDAGQRISEHRAPFVATVHVLEGQVRFEVSGNEHVLGTNDWLIMPPDEPHDLVADAPTKFLLTMLKP